jgi:hypothetical protein
MHDKYNIQNPLVDNQQKNIPNENNKFPEKVQGDDVGNESKARVIRTARKTRKNKDDSEVDYYAFVRERLMF